MTNSTSQSISEAARNPPGIVRGGVKRMLVALILLQAIALGLKAWQDRQDTEMAMISQLATEAALVGEHIQGRIAAARTAMALAETSAASKSGAAAAAPGVDIVITLRDAMQSPTGSRLKVAGETAASLVASDKISALSPLGDIVVLSDPERQNPTFAIVDAESWIKAPGPERRLTLIGGRSVGIGAPGLADIALGPTETGSAMAGRLVIVDQSCSRLGSSAITACATSARKRISTNDIVGLIIYGLLFAAPVFAILGLMERIAGQDEFDHALEEQEDESARLMALVTNGAEVGYWEVGDGFETVNLSDKATSLLGPGGGERLVSLEGFLAMVHRDDREQMTEVFDQAAANGWVNARFRVAGGETERWLELRGGMSPEQSSLQAASAEDAGPPQTVYGGIVMDVTEQKTAEERIKMAERRLRSAIETFSGPFALWDRRKRLLYWNRAFAVSFGLEDALRSGVSHDTVAMTRASFVLSETVSNEDSNTTLYALKNGQSIKLVERATAEGGLITVGVDVTDDVRNERQLTKQKSKLKRLVSELERSEGHAAELAKKYGEEKARAEYASKSKSAFLANMSHELRTPLNAINGFSEIIATELYGPLGDERYKGYAADILASGQHLLDMINEILDMAKIEAGKMSIDLRPIDPVDPVDAAVRMIRRRAEEKDISLKLKHEENLPNIQADHRAIRQMVLNLVSNAIKFTDAGGRVMVMVRKVDKSIMIAVRDTGVGISGEDLPRLGTPFEQASNQSDQSVEGSGLGLALTKSFAEMHGGKMTLASEVGKGTLATIYLPIEPAKEQTERDVA